MLGWTKRPLGRFRKQNYWRRQQFCLTNLVFQVVDMHTTMKAHFPLFLSPSYTKLIFWGSLLFVNTYNPYYQLFPIYLFACVGAHVCACSCLHAISVCHLCVHICGLYSSDTASRRLTLYIIQRPCASQYTLKRNLNKGREKNKTEKAEVVCWAPWNGEISKPTNKRKREVKSICIAICKMACWK